jgi:hypothetical protein
MRKTALYLAGSLSVLWLVAASTGTPQAGGKASFSPAVPTAPPGISAEFGRIPVQFIPNEGQVDGPAAFYVLGGDRTIYFAAEGLTFALVGPREPESEIAGRWVVKLDFVDANPEAVPASVETSGSTVSFFKGRPGDWRTGLGTSSKIVYRELWPGIDLLYYGTAERMKYEFIVHPGGDPSRIKLAYRGAESVALRSDGRLEVSTPVGGFEDDVPVAWQEVGEGRADVAVSYVLEDGKDGPESRTRVYGFEVGEYDESLPLVLDPAILVYCGYIGGSSVDTGRGVAVDGLGHAYITGYTTSSEPGFPAVAGPDLTFNGSYDAFVAKVSADGTALVYCGYIGGSASDYGYAVAVDDTGHAYVTGMTYSTADTFPVIAGPDLTYNGGRDAFVAKVSADGTDLVYCGYIGGTGGESGRGIAVDGSGHAYVTGRTSSFEFSFPVAVGPSFFYKGGDYDAFVAKVEADGTGLAYCGYIGGENSDYGNAIAVDGSGCAYVTGTTYSTEISFPTLGGPDIFHNGGADAFVAKVNPGGTGFVYSGFIGGANDDEGLGIAADDFGCAYVTGTTFSTETTFPVLAGPDLTHNGGADAFVIKLNETATVIFYSGFIGGADDDAGSGIAVDGLGHAYVTGDTFSTEATFPVAVGPGLVHSGDRDAFAAKVNVVGTGLAYCGYIGGADLDLGTGIAVDGSGNTYVAGYTRSTEATFPVVAGPGLVKPAVPGFNDGFVAKISAYDIPGPALTSLVPSVVEAGDPPLTLSVVGGDFSDQTVVRWDRTARPTTFLNEFELNVELAAADLETGKIVEVTALNPDGGVSNALEFTINNPMPSLTSISPDKTAAAGVGFVLTLEGSNFVPGSVVHWDGGGRTTTYVSGTELQAAIASADIAAAGQFPVTVVNPAPIGGTSDAVEFTVVTFTVDISPEDATVPAGQSADFTIEVTPQQGSFDTPITFNALGLPTGCTATFTPGSVTPGTDPASVSMTLSTTARPAAAGGMSASSGQVPPALALFFLVPALGLLLRARDLVRPGPFRRRIAAAAMICLILFIGGCSADGGGGQPDTGTPAGTYTITVRAASGTLSILTTVTLVVQ